MDREKSRVPSAKRVWIRDQVRFRSGSVPELSDSSRSGEQTRSAGSGSCSGILVLYRLIRHQKGYGFRLESEGFEWNFVSSGARLLRKKPTERRKQVFVGFFF